MRARTRRPSPVVPLLPVACAPVLVVALLFACRGEAPAASSSQLTTAALPKDTVALVNGAPLTSHEVLLQQRAPSPLVTGGAADARSGLAPQAALDALVLLELQAQRAVELGLDRDADFVALVERAEAGLRDLKRRELAKRYRTKEVMEKSTVTDEAARASFDANVARVQTELSVLQLSFRDRAAGEAAVSALAAGKSFDALGAEQFPGLPPSARPWERKALPWDQVPVEWWPAIDALQPGQRTGLIEGARGRFWLVELVERRTNSALTFELAKPRVQAMLKADAYVARRAQLERELRDRARVEVLRPLSLGPAAAPMQPTTAAPPQALPPSPGAAGEPAPGAPSATPAPAGAPAPAPAHSGGGGGPGDDD